MTVCVREIDTAQAKWLIISARQGNLSEFENRTLASCLLQTTELWAGLYDDKLVCAWGLIPPTIMSNQAYLWLFHTDAVKEHEFLFIRHSQLAVREMLKRYPSITGVCDPQNSKTVRWLKWLGASLGEPMGKLIPFVIRKSNG